MKTVKFRGEIYLFGGESLDEGGFIATREAYENGLASYAHYLPDIGIFRYGEKIGERSDLEIVGETNTEVDFKTALVNILTHPSWHGGIRTGIERLTEKLDSFPPLQFTEQTPTLAETAAMNRAGKEVSQILKERNEK